MEGEGFATLVLKTKQLTFFSNANEYMCSSLKSLNIATSAVAYDKQ